MVKYRRHPRRLIGITAGLVIAATALVAGLTASRGAAATTQTSEQRAAAAINAACPAAPEQTNVTAMTDWLPWADAGEYYAALYGGYFKAAGLNVQIVPPASSGAQEQLAIVGKANFVIGFLPDVLQAAQKGLPLYAVGVTMHDLGSGLFSLKSEHITKASDLKGKTVGLPNKADAQAYFNAMLKAGGLTRSDVKVVDPGYNAVADVISHKIDLGWGLTFAEGVQANDLLASQHQPPVNWLLVKKFGTPNFYYQLILTGRNWVQSHPNTACRFLAALELGAKNWMANPAPVVAKFIKLNNQFTPQAHRQITNLVKGQWKGSPSLFYEQPKIWAQAQNWAIANGLISKAKPLSTYFTNQYLPYHGKKNVG